MRKKIKKKTKSTFFDLDTLLLVITVFVFVNLIILHYFPTSALVTLLLPLSLHFWSTPLYLFD